MQNTLTTKHLGCYDMYLVVEFLITNTNMLKVKTVLPLIKLMINTIILIIDNRY